jgi:hypothetical protein
MNGRRGFLAALAGLVVCPQAPTAVPIPRVETIAAGTYYCGDSYLSPSGWTVRFGNNSRVEVRPCTAVPHMPPYRPARRPMKVHA